jgi:outer membrane immunogenic protein
MFQSTSLAAVLAGAALFSIPAFSQEEGRSEASVQFMGTFVKSTTNDGVRQSSTDSGGVLASYRFLFTRRHGLEVNYGYSRSTQSYDSGAGPRGASANQHEVTAAYVLRFPMHWVTPFVEAGVGGLVFSPRDVATSSTQSKAAFVYGGGADMAITHGVFVRAAYRGLVYSSPTFDDPANAGFARTTHQAEPSIGLGLRF